MSAPEFVYRVVDSAGRPAGRRRTYIDKRPASAEANRLNGRWLGHADAPSTTHRVQRAAVTWEEL